MLTTAEIQKIFDAFNVLFPFAVGNMDKFTEAQIKAMIPIAWGQIPKRCRDRDKNRSFELVCNLTLHLLISKEADAKLFKDGDHLNDTEFSNLEIGDIKIGDIKKPPVKDDKWNSTKFGSRAKYLLRICAKSMVGVMV